MEAAQSALEHAVGAAVKAERRDTVPASRALGMAEYSSLVLSFTALQGLGASPASFLQAQEASADGSLAPFAVLGAKESLSRPSTGTVVVAPATGEPAPPAVAVIDPSSSGPGSGLRAVNTDVPEATRAVLEA